MCCVACHSKAVMITARGTSLQDMKKICKYFHSIDKPLQSGLVCLQAEFMCVCVSVFMCKYSSSGENRKCLSREWRVLWPAFFNVAITFSLLLLDSLLSLLGSASDLSHQSQVRHSAIVFGSGWISKTPTAVSHCLLYYKLF